MQPAYIVSQPGQAISYATFKGLLLGCFWGSGLKQAKLNLFVARPFGKKNEVLRRRIQEERGRKA